MKTHHEYIRDARIAFQFCTINAIGALMGMMFAAMFIYLQDATWAIASAMAATFCAFGFAVNRRDYVISMRRANATRPVCKL